MTEKLLLLLLYVYKPACPAECGGVRAGVAREAATSAANRQGAAAPALLPPTVTTRDTRARNDPLQSFHNHVKGIGVTISHLLPVFSLVLQK